ncbi:hypothetical protein HQ325_04415 [Rhodococcus sp. BP-349]|uniref:hypothetical protein n=1 Tax=unclassified Rhodococcus (in: high G+C Gram-positive bacteria) TaxID=192944 RepID=UPI001C9A5914|nr:MULTISPECIES: hypothetical protein [unclassified Rhodococcus (in: high G+C Gram-positive bacteria)]MBY6537909.1 hypothetical protein [Rhodococcus sp. BP-363]MBY6542246.1 hypothetical protein [Rhodococcus sp. BP-369]MBY6561476.1 hypothetical protein [Rhodococcus sp. BP-370]MBY6575768.1 hypothetical protein [Rhodococcus sp. BP-364]MBY6585069.1 hypothetical protein [Rhodococcus sp. BP-358]
MSTPATSAPLRGVTVGTLSVLVTAAAHSLGGAALPSQSAVVALLAVCTGVGWMVSSTPAGRNRLVVALAAAQALGHLTLTVVDGHHHGPLLDPRMAAAHTLAIGVGAVAVHGAERGIIAAARAMRRILPVVLAVADVDTDTVRPARPVIRVDAPARLLDLSGRGTRGPPARLR